MDVATLPQPLAFEWDDNNQNKIFLKHGILKTEAEQAFFNRRLYWFDAIHSHKEDRYNLLGITDLGKILFITFTLRKNKVRVISARIGDKREREKYAKET